MKYFLDSSVLVAAGPSLTSPKLDTIVEQAVRGNIAFVTTELVIEEVVNKFREAVVGGIDYMLRGACGLARSVGYSVDLELPSIQIDTWSAEYERRVRSLFRFNLGGQSLPLPVVGHEEIARRAMSGKRPYVGKTKDGYRDTLIWFAFLDLVSSDRFERVCFLTANTKDFCVEERNQTLHPELIADLEARDIDPANVSVINSLDNLMHRYTESRIGYLLAENPSLEVGAWSHLGIEQVVCDVVMLHLEQYPSAINTVLGKLALAQAQGVSPLGVYMDEIAIRTIRPDFDGSGIVLEANAILDIKVELEAEPSSLLGQRLNPHADLVTDWSIAVLDYEAACSVDLHFSTDWELLDGKVRILSTTGYPDDELFEEDSDMADGAPGRSID